MKLLRFTNTQTPTVEFNAIRADGSFLKLTVFAGNNRVTDEDLATIQNHPNYNSLPELGRVEIIDAPKGADENFESLDKFSGNTISKLIEGELNVARLSRWLAGNNNPRIVEQLNEQIQWLERLGVRERQIDRINLADWYSTGFKREAVQQVTQNTTSYTF